MRSPSTWLPFVFLLAAIGCDSTETSSSGGNGSTTASIKILSPTSGACVEVAIDRTVYVPVTIETTGLSLKPPGVCQATTACGNAVLSVNGVRNNAGAATVIDLISTPEAPLTGTIPLRVSVVGDDGVELKTADGKPVAAEVTFEAKPSCDGNTGGTGGSTTSSTGGAGGSTTSSTGGTGGSTGGSAGSGGTGGAGGSTSSGGTGGATGGAGGATGGAGGATTTSSGGAGGMTMTGGTGGV